MSAFFLQGIVHSLSALSAPTRKTMLTKELERRVPLLEGLGLVCEELTPGRVVLRLPNKVRVHGARRHVHPMAIATVAETAAGLILGMNQVSGQRVVLEAIRAEFAGNLALVSGDLLAVAVLSDQRRSQLLAAESGHLALTTTVCEESRDAAAAALCQCHTEWVW